MSSIMIPSPRLRCGTKYLKKLTSQTETNKPVSVHRRHVESGKNLLRAQSRLGDLKQSIKPKASAPFKRCGVVKQKL